MGISKEGISFDNFMGGINEGIGENLLSVNEAYSMQNMNIDDGNLSTSSTSTQYSSIAETNLGTIATYYNNTVPTLLAGANNKLRKYDETTKGFVDVLTGQTSNMYDCVNFNAESKDIAVLTNGTDVPLIYDGTTARKMKNRRKAFNTDGSLKGYYDANEVLKNTIDEVDTYAPKCRYLELHYERIWLCGDAEFPSKLYFSTADVNGFDPEDFTVPVSEEEANMHGGEIDLYTNDGGKIIGLKVVFDDLVIFKDKSIFKIFGNNPMNYTKIQIFSSNGAIADGTIVNTHVGALFINKDAIFLYDGSNVRPISQKIDRTFKTLNLEYLHRAVATFHKGKYILAVPENSSQFNGLIIEYDLDKKNFVFKRGMNIRGFAEYKDKLLYSGIDGLLYEYGVGATGQAFYETGWYDLGYINARKDAESIYFIAKGQGQIKVQCITDKKITEKIVNLNLAETMHKVKLKNKGRILKYRIENIAGSTFKLKSVKVIIDTDID
ncbi:MAG: hypothetical protein ACRDA5_02385 [Clostridium sp.]